MGEESRKHRVAVKAKHMIIKYTLLILAPSLALIIAGYTELQGIPRTISVAAGLILGASSPLTAFYITYVRVVRPLLKNAGG